MFQFKPSSFSPDCTTGKPWSFRWRLLLRMYLICGTSNERRMNCVSFWNTPPQACDLPYFDKRPLSRPFGLYRLEPTSPTQVPLPSQQNTPALCMSTKMHVHVRKAKNESVSVVCREHCSPAQHKTRPQESHSQIRQRLKRPRHYNDTDYYYSMSLAT